MALTGQNLAGNVTGWTRVAACLIALALSNTSLASTTRATIKEILISEDFVYVYPTGGVVNPPSCHGSNGDYYSFKFANRARAKEYLAGLLAAKSSGATVVLYGTGSCDDQPGLSETLGYFSIE